MRHVSAPAFSRTGRRSENEDAVWIRSTTDSLGRSISVLAVADGMGGHTHGAKASKIAIRGVQDAVEDWMGSSDSLDEDQLRIECRQLFGRIDQAIEIYTDEHPDAEGMGTTLVLAVVLGDQAYVAHIGDSRAYWVSPDETADQLTLDHSAAAEAVREGRMTEEEVAGSAFQHALTRSLDGSGDSDPDFGVHSIDEPGFLVLCSDGLSGTIEDERLAQELLRKAPLAETTEALVDAAFEQGSEDNISLVVLECGTVERKESAVAAAPPPSEPSSAGQPPADQSSSSEPDSEARSSEPPVRDMSPERSASASTGAPQWASALLGVLVVALLGLGGWADYQYGLVGLFPEESTSLTLPDSIEGDSTGLTASPVDGQSDEEYAVDIRVKAEASPGEMQVRLIRRGDVLAKKTTNERSVVDFSGLEQGTYTVEVPQRNFQETVEVSSITEVVTVPPPDREPSYAQADSSTPAAAEERSGPPSEEEDTSSQGKTEDSGPVDIEQTVVTAEESGTDETSEEGEDESTSDPAQSEGGTAADPSNGQEGKRASENGSSAESGNLAHLSRKSVDPISEGENLERQIPHDAFNPNTFRIETVEDTGEVGTEIELSSGALLTVEPKGRFSYAPNGTFKALGTGDEATDEFTYTAASESGDQKLRGTVEIPIRGENTPPELKGTKELTVRAGQVSPITSRALTATDPDDEAEKLRFTVTEGPTRGEIRVGDGSSMARAASSFTQRDIEEGRVFYADTTGEGGEDTFTVAVRDENGEGVEGALRVRIEPPDPTGADATETDTADTDTTGTDTTEMGSQKTTADNGKKCRIQFAATNKKDVSGELTPRDSTDLVEGKTADDLRSRGEEVTVRYAKTERGVAYGLFSKQAGTKSEMDAKLEKLKEAKEVPEEAFVHCFDR